MYWRDMHFPIPAYALALLLIVGGIWAGAILGSIIAAGIVLTIAYNMD